MSRSGARPLAAIAGTARPRNNGRQEWRPAANDNLTPFYLRLAKTMALAAVLALVALAALTL